MARDENILRLAKAILEAHKTIIFTGAGVSTSSGYPDLEGMQKITRGDRYFNGDLLELLTNRFARNNPKEFYRLYRKTHFRVKNSPSPTHKIISMLQADKLLAGVITMNLDHLHTLAGSKSVVEYWGSINDNYCVAQHHYFDMSFIATHKIPHCPQDGSLILPVFVERNMVALRKELIHGEKAIDAADLLIVCGTKAAHGIQGHPHKIAVINMEPIELENQADIVVHAPVDQVFSQLVTLLYHAKV